MAKNNYEIREICGDWALDIHWEKETISLFFNSQNNAELVKTILEWEDAHPNAAVPYKPTLTPPNEPLTIEQLREMDGEPAYLKVFDPLLESGWHIIKVVTEDKIIFRGWQTVYVPIDGIGIDYNLYRLTAGGRGGRMMAQLPDIERWVKEAGEKGAQYALKLLEQEYGVSAHRLHELAEADRDGRCVVLPVEVGQNVYFINQPFDSEICTAIVIGAEINLYTPSCPIWIEIEWFSPTLGKHKYHSRADLMIGKTVFLTGEEAEKALRRKQDDEKHHIL